MPLMKKRIRCLDSCECPVLSGLEVWVQWKAVGGIVVSGTDTPTEQQQGKPRTKTMEREECRITAPSHLVSSTHRLSV